MFEGKRIGVSVGDGRIELAEGYAESMGEGVFIVVQSDEYGEPQTVVLTPSDLEALLAHRR